MKYVKLFENFEQEPLKIGDYVILDHSQFTDGFLSQQLENQMGQVIDIQNLPNGYPVLVKFPQYEELAGLQGNGIRVEYDEILYWAEDKEELEARTIVKKYNL